MRNGGIQVAFVVVLIGFCAPAHAIGWDSDDFLIGGGPSFTTRIGVFNHDLTFKGYLDSNFATVDGLDFDHAGRMVAVGAFSSGLKVRVYDSSGALVGGFTRSDNLLGNAGDLRVAPDGSYVIGTGNSSGGDGVRRFLPDGTFVQQIGAGQLRALAVVPGGEVWAGGIGTNVIWRFDLASGQQLGTVSIVGESSFRSLIYSAASNSVLVTGGAQVYELDLTGITLRSFAQIGPLASLSSCTRGPNGDVFATTGSARQVLRWNASGDFLGAVFAPVDFGTSGIVWAGNVPEPAFGLISVAVAFVLLKRRDRRAGQRNFC